MTLSQRTMKRGTTINLLLALCLALAPQVFGAEPASDQAIIAFIVRHSLRIREAQALLPTMGNLLKIEARGRVLLPNAGLEGQGVGVVASLPLLDRREKAERTLKVLEVEREVQREAATLLQELRTLQAHVKLGEELLKEMDGQRQWITRRVQEGVEYQKEANHFLLEMYGKRVEVEQRRAQIGSLTEKLVGLIALAQQPTLRAMLSGS